MGMRASSLSDETVIRLMTRYFVPVLFSLDDYGGEKKPKSEADDFERVRQDAGKQGFARGTVTVYILSPEGNVLQTMDVARAMDPNHLVPMLTRTVARSGERSGEPGVQAGGRAGVRQSTQGSMQAERPKVRTRDGLLLHVWTHDLGHDSRLGLAEDWFELTPDQWSRLVPPTAVIPGTSWVISDRLTNLILRHFFPPIKNYDASASEILNSSVRAAVVAVSPKQIEVTLRGSLEMNHPLRAGEKPSPRGQATNGRVTARIRGVVVYDRSRNRVSILQIVSDNGQFIWHWQGSPVVTHFQAAVENED
jgi:hypothetical protein